jgi:hypothetical protein
VLTGAVVVTDSILSWRWLLLNPPKDGADEEDGWSEAGCSFRCLSPALLFLSFFSGDEESEEEPEELLLDEPLLFPFIMAIGIEGVEPALIKTAAALEASFSGDW